MGPDQVRFENILKELNKTKGNELELKNNKNQIFCYA